MMLSKTLGARLRVQTVRNLGVSDGLMPGVSNLQRALPAIAKWVLKPGGGGTHQNPSRQVSGPTPAI